MYLMLSMWGKRGTWSKNDGVGQLQIFWWIWKAARRRSVEHNGGGDGSEVFEGFNKKRAGHWGAPRVVPGVGSGCVCEGVDEIGGPGSLPKEFAVRAVDEAST